ncbi:MAG: manganese efflux pump MntP family protein [Butyricicoccus sp.]
MDYLDVALIGAGLSMDAFAVAVSNEMGYPNLTKRRQAAIPALFGLFQMLMPLTGYWVGSLFAVWMDRYAGILILLILGGIGGKMVWDGLHPEEKDGAASPAGQLSWQMLLMQAVATSIDAFAVGVGFSAVGIAIVPAAVLIGSITFVMCWLAIGIGKMFGTVLEDRAQIAGGALLILIGLKSFF